MGGFQNDPGSLQQEAGFGFDGFYWTESNGAPLTAKAGGGQAGATLLPWMVNNVATVANIGDSVILPPSKPGAILQVANQGANAMTVYAQGSDTINGVAAATGVSQMASSTVTYTCLKAGVWTAQGIGSGAAGQFPIYSTQTGITASTTHTQAGGVPITASQAQISVCANAGDAVTLPAAKAGMEITLVNNGAQSAQVYGNGADTINGTAGATGIALAVTTPIIFYCFNTGAWVTK
jgi:hypothetical protein